MLPRKHQRTRRHQARILVLIAATLYVIVTNTPPQVAHTFRKMQVTDITRTLKQENEELRIEIFKRVSPSVVSIVTNVDVNGQGLDFTQSSKRILTEMGVLGTDSDEKGLTGMGTGFVWDTEGHIITNNHVLDGATEAQVLLLSKSNGKTDSFRLLQVKSADPSVPGYSWKVCKAELVGRDQFTDTAVLKVDAPVEDLHPIEKGTSESLQVGQDVLAIGNPYGMDHTLTQGIISARRDFPTSAGSVLHDCIQTDAAINPGNSGGPLLDRDGKVIGMTTAIISTTGSSSGIGFAIPVDTVSHITNLLIKNGEIVRPSMGIFYSDKVEKLFSFGKGILILGVEKGGPADKAGLKGTHFSVNDIITRNYQIGDIIIEIDGYEVNTNIDLFETLEKYEPGKEVSVKAIRTEGGEEKEIVVQLVLAARN